MDVDVDVTTGTVITAIGAVLALVAAFLPWFGADAPVAGVNPPPTDGVDTTIGLLVVLIALVALAALVVLAKERADVVAAGSGAAVFLLAGLKFIDLEGATDPKVGLYLTLVAGIVLAAGGAYGYLREDEETERHGGGESLD